MKKLLLLLIISIFLVSCGSSEDKKVEPEEMQNVEDQLPEEDTNEKNNDSGH